jgi:hypothetical protein
MKNSSERRKPGSSKSRHDLYGLVLPASVLKSLQKRGIYCTPGISLEHQHLAKRYVLRAVESGGAVSDMGRACAFVAENGTPLPWLQSLNSIAVNGRHAIFLAETANWRLRSTRCRRCPGANARRSPRNCCFADGMGYSPSMQGARNAVDSRER